MLILPTVDRDLSLHIQKHGFNYETLYQSYRQSGIYTALCNQ